MNQVATAIQQEKPPKTGEAETNAVPATVEAAPPLAPVAQPESNALLSMIERAARDPAVDIDKMKQLLDMQRQITKERAEIAYHEAMKAAQAEMPQVARKAKNNHTNSKYATLEAINAAIAPVYTKFGFSLTFGTDASPIDGCYRITCECAHEAGHVKSYHADIPIDGAGMKGSQNKTPTHAFGSTLSYGRRYLTMLIFNVATMDDDDGNAAGNSQQIECISEDQIMELRELIEANEVDLDGFLKYGGVESLADISVREFEGAKNAVIKAGKAKREGR